MFMVTIVGRSQWTREQIAALTDSQLAGLTYDEMVDIVLASGVPMRDFAYIRTMESEALMQLVHWAHLSCCEQRTSQPEQRPADSLVLISG
jgi:hypothetical protein